MKVIYSLGYHGHPSMIQFNDLNKEQKEVVLNDWESLLRDVLISYGAHLDFSLLKQFIPDDASEEDRSFAEVWNRVCEEGQSIWEGFTLPERNGEILMLNFIIDNTEKAVERWINGGGEDTEWYVDGDGNWRLVKASDQADEYQGSLSGFHSVNGEFYRKGEDKYREGVYDDNIPF